MTEHQARIVSYRLERARETLEEARVLARDVRWNACVNRLYYACFYAVSALLLVRNLSSSKHSGIRSLFNLHFVKTEEVSRELGALYNDLFESRQKGDYLDFVRFEEEQVEPWIARAELFVDEVAVLAVAEKSFELAWAMNRPPVPKASHSTVTLFARFLGWSTSQPRRTPIS